MIWFDEIKLLHTVAKR